MMSRRALLAGATATTLLQKSTAFGAVSCSPFNAVGIQQCTVGIEIGNFRTAQQKCAEWCWAACIEAIFAFRGYSVAQEKIVERVFVNGGCQPAVGPQIIYAINGQ